MSPTIPRVYWTKVLEITSTKHDGVVKKHAKLNTTKNFSYLHLILIVAVISGGSVLQGRVSSPGQQSTPGPVPTVLSSGESDWVCSGVPISAALLYLLEEIVSTRIKST
jgi:hypothetical protein